MKSPFSGGKLLVSPQKKSHVPNFCSSDDDVRVTKPDRSRNYFCVWGNFGCPQLFQGLPWCSPRISYVFQGFCVWTFPQLQGLFGVCWWSFHFYHWKLRIRQAFGLGLAWVFFGYLGSSFRQWKHGWLSIWKIKKIDTAQKKHTRQIPSCSLDRASPKVCVFPNFMWIILPNKLESCQVYWT